MGEELLIEPCLASTRISPSTFGGSENASPDQRGAFLAEDCGTRPVVLAG